MNAALRVVVLTYGAGDQHDALLDSLAAEGVGRERILVVHNPSSPGEPAPEREGVEVIRASHNLGYAAGMNLGIARQLKRGCEYLLLLTHDARFRPGSLRRLLAAGEESPSHGALGPALLFTGTETPFSYGGTASRSGALSHRRDPAPGGGLSKCVWIDGGTMLLRAEVLRQVGCFDERFWSYVEDAELCLRIDRAGFGVAVVIEAEADQDPGMSKRLGPWAYLVTRNSIAYARRFAGLRGVAALTARALGLVAFHLLRSAARRSRLRPGDPVETWAVTVGTVRGAAAYFCRRWGPPPPGLPGGGDITNVVPPLGGEDAD